MEMNDTSQFIALIKKITWKNAAALPDFTQKELEAECWAALVIAMSRWDGSKGKLSSWIYTAVTGRMRDLKKRPKTSRIGAHQEYVDSPAMEKDFEEIEQISNFIDDDCIKKLLSGGCRCQRN
jgi:DNA-directed RNA polymerase specialized sigma24 family protein